MRSCALARVRATVQRIDALIVGALVLAAVGTAIGVATYTDDRLANFRVTWSTVEETMDLTVTGSGNAFEGNLTVSTENLTQALWMVRVNGGEARAQPVAIQVELTSPDNTTYTQDSELPMGPTASVVVPFEVQLGTTPNATSLTARSVDAARATLASSLGTTNGTGVWTLRVQLAPTAPGPLGGLESFTVSAQAALTSYAGEVALETPEVGRG